MIPSVFTDVYDKPPEYHPPSSGAALFNSTEYPNLNSVEYQNHPIERTIKMHPIWERVAINRKGHVVIGTNKAHGREWCSTLWSYEDTNINPKLAKFRLQAISHVTNLAYVGDALLLATFRSGAIQLWSTYSEVRSEANPYNLFLVGKQVEHERSIDSFELMGSEVSRAITGGQDFMLKIWDFGEADLRSINSYRFAHLDNILGIADMPNDYSIFATCSRDKSILLWDCRNILPASALYKKHLVGFQDIIWANSSNHTDTYLYVGDESGYVHLMDKRKTNEFLKSNKHFDRPIRKILMNGDHLAIIGNTNIVKVFSISKDEVVYENDYHTHFVRDCIWQDASTLLTVGCDSKMRFHKISI